MAAASSNAALPSPPMASTVTVMAASSRPVSQQNTTWAATRMLLSTAASPYYSASAQPTWYPKNARRIKLSTFPFYITCQEASGAIVPLASFFGDSLQKTMISYADYLTHPKPKKTYISTFLSHLIKKNLYLHPHFYILRFFWRKQIYYNKLNTKQLTILLTWIQSLWNVKDYFHWCCSASLYLAWQELML